MRRKQVKLPMPKETMIRIQKAMVARMPIPTGLVPRSLRGAVPWERMGGGVVATTQEDKPVEPIAKN